MSFDALWRELDALRAERGLSYRRLATRINGIDDRRRISPSTVHDRMANRRRVGWQELRLVVAALRLTEEPWRQRWSRAEAQWRSPSAAPDASAEPAPAPAPAATGPPDAARPATTTSGGALLPADIHEFTGRQREVAEICRRHSTPARGTAVTISTIVGMPGVGKTRCAIHVAHRLRRQLDEIQLYIDLRGRSPGQQPIEPGAALGVLLHMLGVAAPRIPPPVEARAALYRARLDGRRAIVVLDNAASAAQVLPLLPGSPTCHVLITSRRALAIDGAEQVSLDVFHPDEAVALLRRIVGDARVAREPDAAAEIAELCGYVPLAVAVAARRLRNRREWQLADLVRRLLDDRARIGELRVCDRAVHRVFDVSYKQLSPAARRLFRRLGLHPGGEVTADSAAVLLGTSAAEADGVLETLLEEHLVEEVSPGRLRPHDLLLAYARWRAEHDEPPEHRTDAVRRILTWYLRCAAAADRLLAPHRRPVAPDGGYLVDLPHFADYQQALAWCEAERPNLVRAVTVAETHGLDTVAWQLPQALYTFFYLRRHWDDWLGTFRIALAATRRLADPAAEAWVLDGLGVALAEQRQLPAAIDCFNRALRIRRRLGDRSGTADVLNNLGEAYRMGRRFTEAVEFYRKDLAFCRESGDRYRQAISLNNIGKAERALGRLAEAVDHHRQALDACREVGDRFTEGEALNDLADAYLAMGDLQSAQTHFRLALDIRQAIGDRLGAARTQASLGDALYAAASAEATTHWHQAMTVLTELDDPRAAELSGRLSQLR